MVRHRVVVWLLALGCCLALAAPALADYVGCVVNHRNSPVQGQAVDNFDNDSYGFLAQPGETVCFSVIREDDYSVTDADGMNLGGFRVSESNAIDYEGKKIYFLINIP